MIKKTNPQALQNSELIRSKLRLYTIPVDNAFADFWENVNNSELVIDYLIMLHQIMRASVPLMECAVAKCNQLVGTDVIASDLSKYYEKHAQEEKHHDRWALDDLAAVGYAEGDVLARVPPAEIASLTGAHYYWILHHHPVMLLGYLIVLEGYPPTEEKICRLRDASKLPDDAFRTLRLHGELDPTHCAELDDFLNSLPLEANHLEMIGVSMLHVLQCIANRLRSIAHHRIAA